jgi:hypothetical protein
MISEDQGSSADHQHGVHPLAHWASDGAVHCLLEAPDEYAVAELSRETAGAL